MRLGFWPLYILSGIFGSFLICIIAMFAQNFNFLQMLGKNSLYYYGLHYLFIGIIEKIVNVKWGGIIQTLLTFGILIPLVYLYNKLKSKFISRRKV
jgi:fucose 4-O-acetylase-like acetyltransferase